MKLILKLEDLINKILNVLINLVIKSVKRIIPKNLKQNTSHLTDCILKPLKSVWKTILDFLLNWKNLIPKMKEAPKWIIKKIKEKINIVYIKERLTSLFTHDLKNIFSKSHHFISKKGAKKFFAMIVIFITLIYYFIQYKYRKALENEMMQIQMAEKNLSIKPPYFKGEHKQILTEAIKLPIVLNHQTYSSVEISFVAQTSNIFILIFLKKFEYRIKDHLYTTIAPTLSKFVFKREGKRIIAQKIRDEINILLKKYKVRGKVVAIYITEIMLP